MSSNHIIIYFCNKKRKLQAISGNNAIFDAATHQKELSFGGYLLSIGDTPFCVLRARVTKFKCSRKTSSEELLKGEFYDAFNNSQEITVELVQTSTRDGTTARTTVS